MDPIWIGAIVVLAAIIVLAAIAGAAVALRRRGRPAAATTFAATSADRTMVGLEAPHRGDDRTVVGAAPPASDRTVVGVPTGDVTVVVPPPDTAPTVVVRRGPRARITISRGGTGGPFDLAEREYSIGRSSASDIVLQDPSVSGRHAKLVPQGDGFLLQDLGSMNGTSVDGADVRGPHLLRGGEVIGIGEATLRYDRLT